MILAPKNLITNNNDDNVCDYLIIGGGASGWSFTDTLLGTSKQPLRVIMVDQHNTPGGQWNDSYEFVRLHQPSSMYGIESMKLEVENKNSTTTDHRATRIELLQYYANVQKELEKKHDFEFVGDTTFDLAQLTENSGNDNNGRKF